MGGAKDLAKLTRWRNPAAVAGRGVPGSLIVAVPIGRIVEFLQRDSQVTTGASTWHLVRPLVPLPLHRIGKTLFGSRLLAARKGVLRSTME
jgi:hypothetical protein